VPACAPDSSYNYPSVLNLSGAAAGVTKVIDLPHYYRVYGNTAGQIRGQVQRCAPQLGSSEGRFAGYTTYRINWQYDYTYQAGDMCKISTAKVGLHINQAFPGWQAAEGANAGLNSKWQNFITSLKTHENGHVQIDEQYAERMLASLRGLPPVGCGSIVSTVNGVMNGDIAQLNQANENYDAVTNHGATQGAILP
jgi:predicted secreted Zn-dependent protease